jgi:hypothetical protein
MPPLAKGRHFEILRTVLALAEERGSIDLDEAASAVGLTAERLHELLDPVLYLEFRTPKGDIVGTASEFLLTEDGRLMVTNDHWLRSLCAEPPDADTALRLLVAGLVIESVDAAPDAALGHAVSKLRTVVDAELQVGVEVPRCLATAQRAWQEGRSLRFDYVADQTTAVTTREALPYRVYCKWGHWYFQGRELDDTEPKAFRVDRMVRAELGDVDFDPPADTEIPEWFDLSEHERTVRLRLRPDQLGGLPRPHRVGEVTELGEGRVEADIVVAGDRRLEYLLLCLDADVVIVDPVECRDVQRAAAERLLAAYPPR